MSQFRQQFSLSSFLFVGIIAFALLIRIIYLDRVPVGLTNDEVNFILNAKAVFLTGKDIAQIWNPLALTTITGQFPRAELPYLIMAPFIGLFDLSLFTGRLPYAIVGTGIILLTALISWKLFGKMPAIFVAIVGAINPWSIFFSRTAFEVTLALFFFLLGFYLLFITKRWKTLWAMLPFFIGFYCYMGTKLIFIPLTFIFLFYSWKFIHKGKFFKQHLLIFILCLVTFGSFFLRYNTSTTSTIRGAELYTPLTTTITEQVQFERKTAIDNPLVAIFSNKLTLYLRGAVEKYFGAFSPKLLFTNGDSEIHQTLFYHGNFYYLDIIFLLIGLYYVFRFNKKIFLLLLSLLLIAPLPTVASTSGVSYGLRSALLFPILIIFIGLGFYAVITSSFFQKYKLMLSTFLIGSYVLFFLNFLTLYLLKYPIYNAEAPNFSSRMLAKFVFHEAQKQNVFIVTNNPEGFLADYLFYNNLYTNQTKDRIAQIYNTFYQDSSKVVLDNITILKCPKSEVTITNATVIKHTQLNCEKVKIIEEKGTEATKPLSIAGLHDNRGVYDIHNAQYCKNDATDAYIHNITFSDLNIEKLSDERFCNKFILKPL